MRGPTSLEDSVLIELAEGGRAEAARSPFVDPCAVRRGELLIRDFGEEWASSVLRRDISRRSIVRPDLPYLHPGELETLLLAERREFDEIVAPR